MDLIHYVPLLNALVLLGVAAAVVILVVRSRDWSIPAQDAKIMFLLRQMDSYSNRLSRLEHRLDSLHEDAGMARHSYSLVNDRLTSISDQLGEMQGRCPMGVEACPVGKLRRANE